MKTRPAIAFFLLAVATIGLSSPLLAASVACAEDGGTDCCGLDCAICLCCSHTPQTALGDLPGRCAGEQAGSLQPDRRATPREPLPRDILHVPRPEPAR